MHIKTYYQAQNLEDAYQKLQQHPNNTIFGGGVWLKQLKRDVETLIDIQTLGLNQVIEEKSFIQVGSMTSLHDFEQHPLIQSLAGGILSQSASQIMGVNFRNIATIGGSVMGRYPFSDVLTTLLAVDTQLVFYPERKQSLEEYLLEKKPQKEILRYLEIPKILGKGFFKKVSNTQLDFAMLNIAVLHWNHQFQIVLGARPKISKKAIKAMDFLNKLSSLDDAAIQKAAQMAASELDFASNQSATEDYRRQLAQVYVARGLKEVSHHES